MVDDSILTDYQTSISFLEVLDKIKEIVALKI